MSLSTVGLYENGLHLEKKMANSVFKFFPCVLQISFKNWVCFFPPMDESLDCFLSMFKKHLSVMINKGDYGRIFSSSIHRLTSFCVVRCASVMAVSIYKTR